MRLFLKKNLECHSKISVESLKAVRDREGERDPLAWLFSCLIKINFIQLKYKNKLVLRSIMGYYIGWLWTMSIPKRPHSMSDQSEQDSRNGNIRALGIISNFFFLNRLQQPIVFDSQNLNLPNGYLKEEKNVFNLGIFYSR